MRKISLVLTLASVLGLGVSAPSYADSDGLGSIASFFGSTTAMLVDIPQGVAIDTLYRSPKNAWHALAGHFGDEKGFQQNVAGAIIGIPVGAVWGVPAGFFRGAKHGLGSGWEKPFSTESFIVGLEEDK